MSEIQPALTAEEWGKNGIEGGKFSNGDDWIGVHAYGGGVVLAAKDGDMESPYIHLTDPRKVHACAALCLYNQPFGFTQDDVRTLNRLDMWLEREYGKEFVEQYRGVIQKIAALLPPSSP